MEVKIKDVVKKLSEEFPEHALNMRLIYEYYWSSVKQDMKDLKHIVFYINSLGNFNFVKRKVDDFERSLSTYIKNYDELYKDKVENIKKIIQERYDKKNKKREIRKKFIEDMEKQNQNN